MTTTAIPASGLVGKILYRASLGLAVLLFAGAFLMAISRPTVPPDMLLLIWIQGQTPPFLEGTMLLLDLVGDPSVIMPAILALAGGLLLARKWRWASFVALSGVGGLALNLSLKAYTQRPRPEALDATTTHVTYSFPSGHAMLTSILVLVVLILVWRSRWRWPVAIVGLALALVMGYSRVYLGMHYPSDVVAGYCLALLVVALWKRLVYDTGPSSNIQPPSSK